MVLDINSHNKGNIVYGAQYNNRNGIINTGNIQGSRFGPITSNFTPSNALVPYRAPSQTIVSLPPRYEPRFEPRYEPQYQRCYEPPLYRPQIAYECAEYRRPPPRIECYMVDDYAPRSYGGYSATQTVGNQCCLCFQQGMSYNYGGLGYGGSQYYDPYMMGSMYGSGYGYWPWDDYDG